MTEKQYLKAVSADLRRSGMPKKLRKRLEADLASEFSARLERGEAAGEVIRSMGAPEKLAAEFIAENGGAKSRTPAEKALLVFGILTAALTTVTGIYLAVVLDLGFRFQMWLSGRRAAAGGQTLIGGADGPTAIFVTARISPWLYALSAGLPAACAVCFALYVRSRRDKK